MANSLIKIWKNKGKIFEGVKNSVFKKEHIEEIARERLKICEDCVHMDTEGSKCEVPGTQPCCGKCGCSLKFKVRSLASGCGDEDYPRWNPVLSEDEETELKDSIDYQEPEL